MQPLGIALRRPVRFGAVAAAAPAASTTLPAVPIGLPAPVVPVTPFGRVRVAAGAVAARIDRLDVALAATFVVLLAGVGTFLTVPLYEGRTAAAAIDTALHTVSLLVSTTVASHAWRRFRQSRERIALYQGAAFAVMAVTDAGSLLLTLQSLDVLIGSPQTAPEEGLVCALGFGRMLAAALLAAGAFASVAHRRLAVRRHAAAATVAWLVAVTLVVVFSIELAPNALSRRIEVVQQFAGAALFIAAALAYRVVWRRRRTAADAFIALAMVPLAFGMAYGVLLHPSVFRGMVSSADVVRLGVDALLLLALEAESQANIRAIRAANDELMRLKDAEVQRAAMEERAWLARELHDGLAQELWLMKLKTAWLSGLLSGRSDAPDELRLAREMSDTIDAGLAEARGAVAALRAGTSPGGSLDRLLAHELDEFQDRFGLLVEYEASEALPSLPARAASELSRIVREALTNVRKHAEATVVRVTAGPADAELVVVIRDNGRGFNPSAVRAGHYGLATMRERAEQLGGALTITSERHQGTEIEIRLPLAARADV